MDYAGVVLKNKEGKILLQLRDNKKNIPNPDKWVIFGGGVKNKESPVDTVVREIKEELGVSLKKEKLNKLISTNKYAIYSYDFNRKLKKLNLHEGVSMGYFSPKNILFKKNVFYLVRIFFFFYPLISFLKKQSHQCFHFESILSLI